MSDEWSLKFKFCVSWNLQKNAYGAQGLNAND